MTIIQKSPFSNRILNSPAKRRTSPSGHLASGKPAQVGEISFGSLFGRFGKKDPTFEEAIAALKNPQDNKIYVVNYFTHQGWGHRAEVTGSNRDKSLRMNGHGPAGLDLLFSNVRPLRQGDYMIIPTRTEDGQRFAALVRIDDIRYLSDPRDMWFADKVTVVDLKPRDEIGQLLDNQ